MVSGWQRVIGTHQIHKDNEITARQLVCFTVHTFGLTSLESIYINIIFCMHCEYLKGFVWAKIGFRRASMRRNLIRIQAAILSRSTCTIWLVFVCYPTLGKLKLLSYFLRKEHLSYILHALRLFKWLHLPKKRVLGEQA
jgi:hypothetical protein